MSQLSRLALVLCSGLLAVACQRGVDADADASADGPGTGGDDDDDGSDGATDGGDDSGGQPPSVELVGRIGLRRLTIDEYDATVRDVFGDGTTPAAAFLPEDMETPFDNDYATQVASSALVDGAEALAHDIAARVVADAQWREDLAGCAPTGPDDAACMEMFVRDAGRRALRRPLADAEVTALLGLQAYAVETGDFWVGFETILRALLQHPEMLYRVEIGTPVDGTPGLFRLRNHEVVTRLSYFLWGSSPSDALLDAADAAVAEDRLLGSDDLRALATEMLADERARAQVDRFHALWLGYDAIPYEPELASAMRTETRALLDRLVFEERRPWRELLVADETFLTPDLAAHYGLPAPAGAGAWVEYGDDPRRGLLSHGSFLSNGVNSEDTRMVMRGLAVRTRLLCGVIPPPPPEVNADDEPTGASPCKWDRYLALREPACDGCHALINPLGWGLEQYDQLGRFRENDNWGCALEEHAVGEIQGLGSFRGPGELGALLADAPVFTSCFGDQLYRFAMGRAELDADDRAIVDDWLAAAGSEFRFDDLLLEFVADEAFLYRREPEGE